MPPIINLPLPILIHAVGLCSLGLHLTFTYPHKTKPQPQQDTTILGIASLGLGLAYLSTSYMPQNENQWLYASAPVRMILAGVAGIKLVVNAWQGGELKHEQVALWGILLYDGLGGFMVGWWLGSWGGRVPAFQ